jgi:hypothetical protein
MYKLDLSFLINHEKKYYVKERLKKELLIVFLADVFHVFISLFKVRLTDWLLINI